MKLEEKIGQLESDKIAAEQLLADVNSKLELCYELRVDNGRPSLVVKKRRNRTPGERSAVLLRALAGIHRPLSAQAIADKTDLDLKAATSGLCFLYNAKLVSRAQLRPSNGHKLCYHYTLPQDQRLFEVPLHLSGGVVQGKADD